jgi:hypothetical protein
VCIRTRQIWKVSIKKIVQQQFFNKAPLSEIAVAVCQPETFCGVTHDTFRLEGKNFNLENYSFISVRGDSCAAIKRDKVDLMVKHSTIEERSLFAYTSVGVCTMVTMANGNRKQTDADN